MLRGWDALLQKIINICQLTERTVAVNGSIFMGEEGGEDWLLAMQIG